MASQSDNCSGSHKTLDEPSHVPRTLGNRGAKLLSNAQSMAKATSKQRLCYLLLEGGDSREFTIKRPLRVGGHFGIRALTELTNLDFDTWPNSMMK